MPGRGRVDLQCDFLYRSYHFGPRTLPGISEVGCRVVRSGFRSTFGPTPYYWSGSGAPETLQKQCKNHSHTLKQDKLGSGGPRGRGSGLTGLAPGARRPSKNSAITIATQ